MNKILLISAAFFIIFITLLVIFIIRRKKMIIDRAAVKVGFIAAMAFTLIAGVFSAYFSVYYHALPSVGEYLTDSADVDVTDTSDGYLFDGKGKKALMIFYPGAKVEYTAYAPLMHEIAAEGVDCFMSDMPFNFALFDRGLAGRVIRKYEYKEYYIAGHSLGGVAASRYCASHTDKLDGLILLASYSSVKISDDVKVLSIYGSRDGCLNMNGYQESKVYLPENSWEYVIEGGNHAQFGEYGPQDGDRDASISPEEQREKTADEICLFIGTDF